MIDENGPVKIEGGRDMTPRAVSFAVVTLLCAHDGDDDDDDADAEVVDDGKLRAKCLEEGTFSELTSILRETPCPLTTNREGTEAVSVLQKRNGQVRNGVEGW